MKNLKLCFGMVALCAFFAQNSSAQGIELSSPNRKLHFELKKTGENWQLIESFNGREIVKIDAIGFRLQDEVVIGTKGEIYSDFTKHYEGVNKFAFGKAKNAPNIYNEKTIEFQENTKLGPIGYTLILRAYDSGLAFRQIIRPQAKPKSFILMNETTQFKFSKNYECWALNQGRFENAHEGEYDAIKIDKIRTHNLLDYPLTCKTGTNSEVFAINEVDVEDYPASFLSGRGDGALGLGVAIAPSLENDSNITFNTIAARYDGTKEVKMPWRVIAFADAPKGLVESNIFQNLAPASRIGDTSWIKPGKVSWDWWNGWALDIEGAGINTKTYLKYIDFAHEMGLEYILIDEGWYEGSSEQPNSNAKITTPIAQMDIPQIVEYAKGRNIGVMVWLQWSHLDADLENALKTYAAWGLKGIKVDFMNRSDREMVNFYHKLIEKAAQNQLIVNMHGAYIPNGLSVTYPNFMTQEGVMGAEYNKWSSRVTARHNVTLPFTRMLAGPMDYTPGGFRNTDPKDFPSKQSFIRPWVQTTRAHGLAMYVVYDSPIQMVADNPEAYKKPDGTLADGAQFLKEVPTIWDETKIIDGEIGEFIISARRVGENWYVGAMTNERARNIRLPLSFLSKGKYEARIYEDGASPSQLRMQTRTLDKQGFLDLKLSQSGGAVIQFIRKSE